MKPFAVALVLKMPGDTITVLDVVHAPDGDAACADAVKRHSPEWPDWWRNWPMDLHFREITPHDLQGLGISSP